MRLCTVLVALFAVTLAPEGAAETPYDGDLFDAHCHLRQPGEAGNPTVPDLVRNMREAGISGILLFGPEEVILEAEREAPRFVHPSLDLPSERLLRLEADDVLPLVARLEGSPIEGLGELPFHHKKGKKIRGNDMPMDGPEATRILDLARERRLVVTVHVEAPYASEIDGALVARPDLLLVWAHAGDATPSLVAEKLRSHANLHTDLSCLNPFFRRGRPPSEQSLVDSNGRLKDEWREVFLEFPDRFLFGLDLFDDRYARLQEVVAHGREMLGQLPRDVAEKIAHGNAERILGGALEDFGGK